MSNESERNWTEGWLSQDMISHWSDWPAIVKTAKVANVIEMDSMVNGNQSDQHNQHS